MLKMISIAATLAVSSISAPSVAQTATFQKVQAQNVFLKGSWRWNNRQRDQREGGNISSLSLNENGNGRYCYNLDCQNIKWIERGRDSFRFTTKGGGRFFFHSKGRVLLGDYFHVENKSATPNAVTAMLKP